MAVVELKKKPNNKKNRKDIQQIVQCQIKYTQFTSETPYTVLLGITEWLGEQKNHFVKDLRTLASIFELYDIVTVGYDEKSIDAVMQGIRTGALEPTKWNGFVMDRNLNEQDWPVFKKITQDWKTEVQICK